MERITLSMVRETCVGYEAATLCSCPEEAYKAFLPVLGTLPYESIQAIFLDNFNAVIGITEVSRGGLSFSVLEARQVFTPALLCNATKVMIAHNHPSGSVIASFNDLETTKRLVAAGKILGIDVIDHLIIPSCGNIGNFGSIRKTNPEIF